MAQEDLYRRVISNINNIDLDALSKTKEKNSNRGFVRRTLNTDGKNIDSRDLPLKIVAKFARVMDMLINEIVPDKDERKRNAEALLKKRAEERKIVEGLKSDKRIVNKYVGKGKPQSDLGPAFRWFNKTANRKTNFSPSIKKNLNIGT